MAVHVQQGQLRELETLLTRSMQGAIGIAAAVTILSAIGVALSQRGTLGEGWRIAGAGGVILGLASLAGFFCIKRRADRLFHQIQVAPIAGQAERPALGATPEAQAESGEYVRSEEDRQRLARGRELFETHHPQVVAWLQAYASELGVAIQTAEFWEHDALRSLVVPMAQWMNRGNPVLLPADIEQVYGQVQQLLWIKMQLLVANLPDLRIDFYVSAEEQTAAARKFMAGQRPQSIRWWTAGRLIAIIEARAQALSIRPVMSDDSLGGS